MAVAPLPPPSLTDASEPEVWLALTVKAVMSQLAIAAASLPTLSSVPSKGIFIEFPIIKSYLGTATPPAVKANGVVVSNLASLGILNFTLLLLSYG